MREDEGLNQGGVESTGMGRDGVCKPRGDARGQEGTEGTRERANWPRRSGAAEAQVNPGKAALLADSVCRQGPADVRTRSVRGVGQSGGSCDVPCFCVKREMNSLAKLEREKVGFVVG